MKVESPQVDLDNEMDEEHSPKLFSAQNPADSFVFDTKIDELALKLRVSSTIYIEFSQFFIDIT